MTANEVLAAVGPRLRALRRDRNVTLATLAEASGISVSTLSRLESGQRKATLELLLPLAGFYPGAAGRAGRGARDRRPEGLRPPDEGAGRPDDPAADRQPGGLLAFKHIIPASTPVPEVNPQSHEGYEWLYVLSGRLRLVLGEHDLVLPAGEAAEFDTRVPHWFYRAGTEPVEFLSIFGRQGERIHVRARSTHTPS